MGCWSNRGAWLLWFLFLLSYLWWILDDITLTYPFFHRPSFPILEDGWHAFAPEAEFNHIQSHVGSEWRLSQVNKNYEVWKSCWKQNRETNTLFIVLGDTSPICPSLFSLVARCALILWAFYSLLRLCAPISQNVLMLSIAITSEPWWPFGSHDPAWLVPTFWMWLFQF